jgi:hypothetical protein
LCRANSGFECERNQILLCSFQQSDGQQQQQQQNDDSQQISSSETTLQLCDPEYTAKDLVHIQKCLEASTGQLTGSNNDLPIPSLMLGSSIFSELKNPNDLNTNSDSFIKFEDELYQNFSLQNEENTSPTFVEPKDLKKRRRGKESSKARDNEKEKPPDETLVKTLREIIRRKNLKQRAVAKALDIRFESHAITHNHTCSKLSYKKTDNKFFSSSCYTFS